jgi:hypothetical protein
MHKRFMMCKEHRNSLCGLLCNKYLRIYNRQPKIRLSSAKSCSLLAQSVTQSSPQPLYAPPPRLAGRTITKGSPQAETGPHSARSSDSGLRDVRATLGRWYGCSLLRFAACFLMARTFGARELRSFKGLDSCLRTWFEAYSGSPYLATGLLELAIFGGVDAYGSHKILHGRSRPKVGAIDAPA